MCRNVVRAAQSGLRLLEDMDSQRSLFRMKKGSSVEGPIKLLSEFLLQTARVHCNASGRGEKKLGLVSRYQA